MIKRGERIGIAVSGGKDSLSLLKVLHGLEEGRGTELVALSVDEGIRGYKDEALAHTRVLAEELSVELVTVSYRELFGFELDQALNWKDERETPSCSICGVLRRRALDEAALKAKVTVIATAHNLDDCVQTFMMNLFHGDVDRLGWLDPSHAGDSFRVRRVKPFMEIYEEEIALFAYQSGLPFQSVSCPYMHEGLRSEVRDYLNEMEARHPGMKNVLLKTSLDVISRYGRVSAKHSMPCETCGWPSSSGRCNVCKMKEQVQQHINYAA